jgi:hypothetical protein
MNNDKEWATRQQQSQIPSPHVEHGFFRIKVMVTTAGFIAPAVSRVPEFQP